MNYAEMTNAELDDLMATRVMGWGKAGDKWIYPNQEFYIFSDEWQPSTMEESMVDVLLKVLADGVTLELGHDGSAYWVYSDRRSSENRDLGQAPTLPRAMCEAIAAAYEERK
jgi:hypothetical protein